MNRHQPVQPHFRPIATAMAGIVVVLSALQASSASHTLTLRSGGSVRLPNHSAGFTPTISVNDCSSFEGFVAEGEEPATPEGVSYSFLRQQGRQSPATGRATLVENGDGTLTARWVFTLNEDAAQIKCGIVLRLPHADFSRESFALDGHSIRVDGVVARVAAGTEASCSDGLDWWPYAPYWFLDVAKTSATNARKGDSFEISCVFVSEDGTALAPAFGGSLVIDEGTPGWVRMDHRKTIHPGSALDLSGLLDAPAGKYGWIRNVGGRLEFEARPGVAARLSGVNFCNEANYPETPERAAELAGRLARLGYNALRIHHHDDFLARYENGELVPIAENVSRLDCLAAECIKRGIYLTTDLYVSRRVTWHEMGIDRDGAIPMGLFKAFQLATERGFRDWCDFARLFLSHVNPHTGRSYADEPAMPLLCLQNETAFEDWNAAMTDPDLGMAAHWRMFLLAARADNPGSFPGFDPNSPPGGGQFWDDNGETAVKSAFWVWLENRFYERAERFLREELGVKALLTGDNYGPTPAFVQEMRASRYDYCDAHLYPGGWWRWLGGNGGYTPPGLVKAHNPLVEIRAPVEGGAWERIWGVPFIVTEWDFVAPMAERSMSGLVFGSMAALQGWSAAWRFAYEHHGRNFGDNRGVPGLYNLVRDPLALASDRATQLLFLRGDMDEAQNSLALDFGDQELDPALGRTFVSGPHWKDWFRTDLPWTHRVGVSVRGKDVPPGATMLPRASVAGQTRAPDFRRGAIHPSVSIDRARGIFIVETPRTCGVFAEGGVHTAGVLRVVIGDAARPEAAPPSAPTTVFASSLDGAPLASSSRILVTHLTDAKARGATFMDDSRLVLLRWGGSAEPDGTMPVLLREDSAEIELRFVNNPVEWRVYALGSDGKRECEVPCVWVPDFQPEGRLQAAEGGDLTGKSGRLSFTASVRQPFGGCMLYEVTRE